MSARIDHHAPEFGPEEAEACGEYMRSGGFVTEYKKTRELEEMIERFTGARHCVMVSNGTVSLVVALLAVGVGPGDRVLVPDLTMVATINAVKMCGAVPVVCDVDGRTLTLAASSVERAIGSVRCVIHVSLNGRAGDVARIARICRERGVPLLEDAAQSLGSFSSGQHLGTFGDVGSFSFSSPKIITTGQGGALVTDSDELAAAIRSVKDFGRPPVGGGGTHDFERFGINAKFTDLQAVVGIEQMRRLQGRIESKRRIWRRYKHNLGGAPGVRLLEDDEEGRTPWVMDVYCRDPVSLAAFLRSRNVHTRKQYPALRSLPSCAEAETLDGGEVAAEHSVGGLWLPCGHQLTDHEVDSVCAAVREWLARE